MQDFKVQLHKLVDMAIQEDVGEGDHSSLSCIPPDQPGKGVLFIKQEGILAGVQVAKEIFTYLQSSIQFEAFKADGDLMRAGEKAFEVFGNVHVLLKAERLVLNCMQRMSGIATLTRKYVDELSGTKTGLLDTRKTTPNFRLLEKEAVRIGGGVNHRFGLYDMIMLKDNHIDYAGGISAAVEKAWRYIQDKPHLKIEVETRNLQEVHEVAHVGKGKVFRVMLDNFQPEQIVQALQILGDDFETEASGGIHLSNIRSYANTGVTFVSVGGLIHQAQSLDLSLKAEIL